MPGLGLCLKKVCEHCKLGENALGGYYEFLLILIVNFYQIFVWTAVLKLKCTNNLYVFLSNQAIAKINALDLPVL